MNYSRESGGARTGLADLEDLSDEELEALKKEFKPLGEKENGKSLKTEKKKK